MTNIKPILFCDFDGVLCHDRYWRSLPEKEYNKIQKFLFGNDTTLIDDWMLGKYSAEEINQIISKNIGMSFEELWEIFVEDCKTMQVSEKALEGLHSLREQYTVILITGNMDSFSRFTQPALNLDKYFDHISNSYYEGMNKTDNQGELFIKYANKYGVQIKDCILFDDLKRVHKIFSELGGRAYLVTSEQDIIYHLNKGFKTTSKP